MVSTEEDRVLALNAAARRAEDLAAAFDDGVEVESRAGASGALLCAYFGMRTSRQVSAVVHLCSNGYGVESQSLLRNMLQDMADVRYIATNPETLAEQWRTHESRRRFYIYTTRRELQEMDEPHDFSELKALIDQDWRDAAALAAERHHKNTNNVTRNESRKFLLKDRWTRLSIRGAAEAAERKYPGTLKLFEWYGYLSEHAHGSPGISGDYLQQVGDTVYVKDHRDPRFKSASMAVSALVYGYATFEGLCDIGLKYDPAPLIEDVPVTGPDFGDI